MITTEPILIAIAGGIIPTLVWLLFWLRQDRKSPEPKGLIAISFFAGMAAIIFVLPLEKLIAVCLPTITGTIGIFTGILSLPIPQADLVQILLWAFTEEFLKLVAVFFIAFQSRHFDEPVDAVIYLITASLGFAALENTLYLLKGLTEGDIWSAALESNLRFIGATILHIAASGIVGIMVALSFYRGRITKFLAVSVGLIGATLLHAYFNLSIIDVKGTIPAIAIFSQFWMVIIGVIIFINIIKRIKKPNTPRIP